MEDKEMIEEMARKICPNTKAWTCKACNWGRKPNCDSYNKAEYLIKLGYRNCKDKVVLSKEELFKDSTQLPREKQVENIRNIILENIDYGYDETARAIYNNDYRKIPKLGVILPFDHYDNLLKTDSQIRKETAKEIFEAVKSKCKELENKYSHLCKSKKECLMETCRYEGVLAVKRELYEIAEQFGVEVEE